MWRRMLRVIARLLFRSIKSSRTCGRPTFKWETTCWSRNIARAVRPSYRLRGRSRAVSRVWSPTVCLSRRICSRRSSRPRMRRACDCIRTRNSISLRSWPRPPSTTTTSCIMCRRYSTHAAMNKRSFTSCQSRGAVCSLEWPPGNISQFWLWMFRRWRRSSWSLKTTLKMVCKMRSL
jgi:hypothetical protein